MRICGIPLIINEAAAAIEIHRSNGETEEGDLPESVYFGKGGMIRCRRFNWGFNYMPCVYFLLVCENIQHIFFYFCFSLIGSIADFWSQCVVY
jgi:hypothetical protein